jgi:hypothetical protein
VLPQPEIQASRRHSRPLIAAMGPRNRSPESQIAAAIGMNAKKRRR